MNKDNPLLNIEQFPNYNDIKPEYALSAIDYLCDLSKKEINELLKNNDATWDTYERLEYIDDRLSKAWSPISHLYSVKSNDEWRKAYQDCQPIISKYSAEMSQNSGLYDFYCRLKDGNEFSEYSDGQKKLVIDAIRDFELSGVNLSDEKKDDYQKLSLSASKLYTTFSNNLLDSSESFYLHITDKDDLLGIPESAMSLYKQLAKENKVDGYWLTLDYPSYVPALSYAENRELREKLYYAYVTRSSELGENKGKFDNTDIIKAILAVRSDLADILGFSNYAEMSLSNKMAKSSDQVISFLNDLVEKSKKQGVKEYDEILSYAKEKLNIDDIKPWDISYVSEKLKQDKYAISEEQLRNYFPVPKVMTGLFSIVNKLFGVYFEKNSKLSKWHDDVDCYTVKNSQGDDIAFFYIDLYARKGKRSGAWMDAAVDRVVSNYTNQKPVAYLTCNFIPPNKENPAYLSHVEVITLFHEFGHGLHHMLTKINHSPISGINGVEWDAVELPSQFMENFCFEKDVLKNMTEHKETGESLPDELFDKIIASKNYHSALGMLRQLEFSLFDMKIHADYDSSSPLDVMQVWDDVKSYVSVIPSPDYARFPMSFSHVFAGGYAAGYFSYKWAEVLSADAFSRFEEEGVYNSETGLSFKKEILERGSSRKAMDNFFAFRGREPEICALLRHNGIFS